MTNDHKSYFDIDRDRDSDDDELTRDDRPSAARTTLMS